jgi:hypothetical protein
VTTCASSGSFAALLLCSTPPDTCKSNCVLASPETPILIDAEYQVDPRVRGPGRIGRGPQNVNGVIGRDHLT